MPPPDVPPLDAEIFLKVDNFFGNCVSPKKVYSIHLLC